MSICSSCGLETVGESHKTSTEPDHLGRIREVCTRCWNDKSLFFMLREIEIHGSYEEVKADQWRKYRDLPSRVKRYTKRNSNQTTII
jgi:hypothetical protein